MKKKESEQVELTVTKKENNKPSPKPEPNPQPNPLQTTLMALPLRTKFRIC